MMINFSHKMAAAGLRSFFGKNNSTLRCHQRQSSLSEMNSCLHCLVGRKHGIMRFFFLQRKQRQRGAGRRVEKNIGALFSIKAERVVQLKERLRLLHMETSAGRL